MPACERGSVQEHTACTLTRPNLAPLRTHSRSLSRVNALTERPNFTGQLHKSRCPVIGHPPIAQNQATKQAPGQCNQLQSASAIGQFHWRETQNPGGCNRRVATAKQKSLKNQLIALVWYSFSRNAYTSIGPIQQLQSETAGPIRRLQFRIPASAIGSRTPSRQGLPSAAGSMGWRV